MINILYGRSGSGKTTTIMNELKTFAEKVDSKESAIFIVPEQMSFQCEYELLKELDTICNVTVYSFTKLALRIMLECGDLTKTYLDDLTHNMILNHCIRKNADKLKVFNKMQNKNNFSAQLADLFTEFSNYLIDFETLEKINDNLDNNNQMLKDKIHDFKIILNELHSYMKDTYKKKIDYFSIMKEHISNSNIIKNTHIFIDGFYSYDGQKLEIVKELMQNAKSVTITFTIDDLNNHDNANINSLFNMTYRNFQKLKDFLIENSVEYKLIQFEKNHRHLENEELKFLEENFANDTKYNGDLKNLSITKYATPRSEVHYVAKKIYDLLANESVRYNDIAVYFSDSQTYGELVKTIFPLYNISFFLDEQKSAKTHPFIVLLNSLMKIAEYGVKNEYLFSILKTGLLCNDVTLEDKKYLNLVSELENFASEYGVNSFLWENKNFSETYKNTFFKNSNLLNFINEYVFKILEVVKKIGINTSVEYKVKVIYDFLMEFKVHDKLKRLSEKEIDNEVAITYEQVWNKFIDMIDKIVSVVGNMEVTNKEFVGIMSDGFENLTYTVIPPVIDKVNIGTLKRSRFQVVGSLEQNDLGINHVFLLGVNDQKLPGIIKESALLNEQERLTLEEIGYSLAPSIEQNFFDDYFWAYTVMSLSKEKLYISFSEYEKSMKELFPSPLIFQLLNKFPGLKIIDRVIEEEFSLLNVTNLKQTYYSLIEFDSSKYYVPKYLDSLHKYFKDTTDYTSVERFIGFDNSASNIDESVIDQLFENNNSISISQAELYNKCSYAYFLRYILRINANAEMKVESFDIGNIFHETLNRITRSLMDSNKSFSDLYENNNDIYEIVKLELDNVISKGNFKTLILNTNYYRIYESVLQKLLNVVGHLAKHSTNTNFKITGSEARFGINEQLKSPTFKIGNRTFSLKGIIDRYDIYSKEETDYFTVVDYKLSGKKVDFEQLYHGVSLQLPLYLYVLTYNNKNKNRVPAGFYFFNIYNSKITGEKIMSEEEIVENADKNVIFTGVSNSDTEVINNLDLRFLEEGKAEYYKIELKKNGSMKSTSAVLEEEEISRLLKYTYSKVKNTMENIVEGKVIISPSNVGGKSDSRLCKYCEFASVCKFEYGIGNKDNYLEKKSSAEAQQEIINFIEVSK